jgi:phosphatidylserine decarboxylase
LLDALFVWFQFCLPARLLGRVVHRLAHVRAGWFKNPLIRGFSQLYGVDADEIADARPEAFPHWNAFFTRELKPGARPLDPDPQALLCPCDGALESAGQVTGGLLLQAKRFRFSVADFLACAPHDADAYTGGDTATIYLAPYDYHRVHMPITGRVCSMVYVPGRRLAVNRRTARTVSDLFARNERVVLNCTSAGGDFAVVLVGALNVASVSLAWAGAIAPSDAVRRIDYADDPRVALRAGDTLGWFNLGSTVVLIGTPGAFRLDANLELGAVMRMGRRIGLLSQDR